MRKSLHLLTPAEKAKLMKQLRKDAEGEKFFSGVLGNKNSFFIAKPLPHRDASSRKPAKATI